MRCASRTHGKQTLEEANGNRPVSYDDDDEDEDDSDSWLVILGLWQCCWRPQEVWHENGCPGSKSYLLETWLFQHKHSCSGTARI